MVEILVSKFLHLNGAHLLPTLLRELKNAPTQKTAERFLSYEHITLELSCLIFPSFPFFERICKIPLAVEKELITQFSVSGLSLAASRRDVDKALLDSNSYARPQVTHTIGHRIRSRSNRITAPWQNLPCPFPLSPDLRAFLWTPRLNASGLGADGFES